MTSGPVDRIESAVRAGGWGLVRAYLEATTRRRTAVDSGSRMAALVHSFDGYKRFWKPAAHFTVANLPHDVPTYFASESQPVSSEGVTPILTGPGSFGDRMRRAVREVEELGHRYVLYLQEDMWLSEPLASHDLGEILGLMDTHLIDALKLADLAEPPAEIDELGRRCARLGEEGIARKVRWFGAHNYIFSHHTTIFRSAFLREVLLAASLFRRVRPLQQEQFCSAYLKPRSVADDGDGGRYRVATFAAEPLVNYVHASEMGTLTDEAGDLLEEHGLGDLYDPDLPGEYYPKRRRAIQ